MQDHDSPPSKNVLQVNKTLAGLTVGTKNDRICNLKKNKSHMDKERASLRQRVTKISRKL